MTSLNSTETSEPVFETSGATESLDAISPLLQTALPADGDLAYLTQQGSPVRCAQPISMPMSPSDAAWLQHENKIMKQKLRQIQIDYKSEQDAVAQLRKRLNSTEKEKLDMQSKANEEVAQAQGEAARLRAQLEKGEAIRQSIEYELAKVRKEISYHQQSAADKEALLSEINEGLKEKIGDLTEQLELSKRHMSENKTAADNDIKRLKMELEEKQHVMNTFKTEQNILESGKERQETQISQLQSTVKEQEEKLTEFQESKRKQTDLLRKQTSELEFSKDREDRLKEDLQATLARVKSLEEAIEAERAAHLESKFNSEIIQLRIRDLEAALEMEKSAKMETIVTSEKLNQQLNEIQQLYDDEKRMGKETREKIQWSEHKQLTVTQQLSAELDEKKAVISKMSSQLEVHQKNFDELKQELAQAKKRQALLEETYGGGMKEMELVLNNFQPDIRTKKKRIADTKEKAKHPTPSDILSTLRTTLVAYKDKVDRTNAELMKSRSRCTALTKETDSYKEMIMNKDKTIEDTQKSMSRTNKELRKLQNEISEHQTTITKLKIDFDVTTKALEKEREENRELHSQTVKLKSKLGNNEHAMVEYLHGLYQRMVTGHVVAAPPGGTFGHFTRSDLITLIDDQVGTLLAAVDKAIQKAKYMETVVQGKDTAIQEMQNVYEEQMERLASVAKEHSSTWQQQKEELEQHYGKMLAEIHTRHKKTQTLADQAWEKMRATGTLQQGLQAECNKLQAQLAKQQQDHNAVLAACALFAGALYSAYLRISALCMQRQLLEQQVNKLEFFKEQVSTAVYGGTVKSGQLSDSKSEKKCSHKRGPLLRFRTGAIVVLAANRLKHIGKSSQSAFVVQDLYKRGDSATVLTGVSDAKPGESQLSDSVMHRWLSSQQLQQVILSSMTDLQQHLCQSGQQTGVAETARKSFRWLMDQLNTFFQLQPQEVSAGLREQRSLVKLLGHGLRRCRSLMGEDVPSDASTEKCLANLQNVLLQQNQCLSQLEGSKQRLQQEVAGLRQEQLNHSRDEDTVALLQQELEQLKARAISMVSRDKFEGVCQELTAALRREEQGQELMKEQGQQLEMLSQQLDQQASRGSQKERTLSDAAKELSECKMELKRKEQLVRQLNRQMGQVEGEKKALHNNIRDAENALHTAARDKDALNLYMKAVAKALEQFQLAASRRSSFELPDATVLLSPELHPHDQKKKKPGPELARCQLLVNTFVDTFKQVAVQIQVLGGQIKAHQEHIKVLKAELNAACRREYDVEREFAEPDRPHVDTADQWYRNMGESPEKDGFSPLIEDKSSISFAPEVIPSQKTPNKSKKLTRSPVNTSTPNYKTPPTTSLRGSSLKGSQARVMAK